MENKDLSNKSQEKQRPSEQSSVDVANTTCYGHILIKDAETGEILINQRA